MNASPNYSGPEKSNTLLLCILFAFFCCCIYFIPRFSALLIGPESWSAKIAVILFLVSLPFVWLYGIYHIMHILFSYFTSPAPVPVSQNTETPPVALLYVTKNDFSAQALRSCIHQDYPNFKLFLCDDSDDTTAKSLVEKASATSKGFLQLIRRSEKTGFKAGNINHALSLIDKKYQYICIADSDNILPQNFLTRLLPHLLSSKTLAFVQAKQTHLSTQSGLYGKIMSPIINLHWNRYMSMKNRYGFVMWYGHAAILRRSAIEAVGKIPEVATEDLAFSSEAARLGYKGLIVPSVTSAEEFPSTFAKYRKRNRKWVRGTYQYLLRYYPKILVSKNVSWIEKADILISALSLLQAIPFLLMIYTACFPLAYNYAYHQTLGPFFLIPPHFYSTLTTRISQSRYNIFWVLDFYLIMVLIIFIPLLPAVKDMWKEKSKMVQYVIASSFTHLAILLDSAKEIFLYTLTGRAFFVCTNDPYTKSENPLFILLEFSTGIYILNTAITTNNLWLTSIGLTFCFIPFMLFFDYKKPLRYLSALPLIITVIVLFLIGFTIWQSNK